MTETSDDGPLIWDMTDWFLRVAEALDQAAAEKGNEIRYGTAYDVRKVVRVACTEIAASTNTDPSPRSCDRSER